MTRAFIGIDVGWSRSSSTCAIAWRGLQTPALAGVVGAGGIGVARVRLVQLLEVVGQIVARKGDDYDDLVVVIDGPVARDGLPRVGRRAVDLACTREPFALRAQSGLLEGPFGEAFVEATSQVLRALAPTVSWLGGSMDAPVGVLVAETHPTVAMAVALQMQTPESLPSRQHAREVPGRGPVRAKSDWYWHLGAGQLAASVLGEPGLATERDHERIAALTCLSLACALGGGAADGSSVVAMGAADGIYVLHDCVHASWKDAVSTVGLLAGVVREGASAFAAIPEVSAAPFLPVVEADEAPDAAVERDPGGLLVLSDNGGLHRSANPWLADCEFPCTLRTLTKPPKEITVHAASGPSAPHRIVPAAHSIASELSGFTGRDLSADSRVAFPFVWVSTGTVDATPQYLVWSYESELTYAGISSTGVQDSCQRKNTRHYLYWLPLSDEDLERFRNAPWSTPRGGGHKAIQVLGATIRVSADPECMDTVTRAKPRTDIEAADAGPGTYRIGPDIFKVGAKQSGRATAPLEVHWIPADRRERMVRFASAAADLISVSKRGKFRDALDDLLWQWTADGIADGTLVKDGIKHDCRHLPHSRAALQIWEDLGRPTSIEGGLVHHEHAVPRKVLLQLLRRDTSPTAVADVLNRLCHAVVVTAEEHRALSTSSMPDNWDERDPWRRYSDAGLMSELQPPLCEHCDFAIRLPRTSGAAND